MLENISALVISVGSIFNIAIKSKSNQTQPWELGKKYDGNFIFTFAVVQVRYGSIKTAKNFKHGNYLK